jgi:uncharacterized protein
MSTSQLASPTNPQARRRKIHAMLWAVGVAMAGLFLSGCHTGPAQAPAKTLTEWQARRTRSIAGTNGWASLVGLHWLPEGRSTCGSDPSQTHVFPAGRAPGFVGTWIREGRKVRFVPADGVAASVNGKAVQSRPLRTDAKGAKPEILRIGDLSVTVLVRGERVGLRVRDPQAPTRVHFQGLEYFPERPDWVLEGKLIPAKPGTLLPVVNVLGDIEEMPAAGTVVFMKDGREYRLDVALDTEEDDLFLLFKDTTSGKETYPAGRFLHAQKPGRDGRVVLDFNRAYNPPCAFTSFATCPLPPRQNRLDVRVEAGELRYRGGH